jgi:hypothetical protein
MMRVLTLALVLALSAFAAGAVLAQDAPSGSQTPANKLGIELNKLAPQGQACRAYLLFQNQTASAFSDLKLDIVVFDTAGIVANRFALQAAPLPAQKTSLKVFDIGGTTCDQIGRLLLNDITACTDQNGPRKDCLDSVALSSLGKVPFSE